MECRREWRDRVRCRLQLLRRVPSRNRIAIDRIRLEFRRLRVVGRCRADLTLLYQAIRRQHRRGEEGILLLRHLRCRRVLRSRRLRLRRAVGERITEFAAL